MSITARCPSCQADLKAPGEYAGRRVKCSKCGEPFVVQAEAPPPLPQEIPSIDVRSSKRESIQVQEAPCDDSYRKRQSKPALVLLYTVLGLLIGGVVGYYAGNYYPFWGGLALLGEIGSPARQMLARNHAMTFGLLSGAICCGLGFVIAKQNSRGLGAATWLGFLVGAACILAGAAVLFEKGILQSFHYAVQDRVDAVIKFPADIAQERASRFAAELFSASWAGTEFELDPFDSGYINPQVKPVGDTWVVDGIFKINRRRSVQVTIVLEKGSYEKKSLELQKKLRDDIGDILAGKLIDETNPANRQPAERSGDRFWTDPVTGEVTITPPSRR